MIAYPTAVNFGPKPYEVIADTQLQLFGPSISRYVPTAKAAAPKQLNVRFPLQLT